MTVVAAAPLPDNETSAPPDVEAGAASAVDEGRPVTGLPYPTRARFGWEDLDPFDYGC